MYLGGVPTSTTALEPETFLQLVGEPQRWQLLRHLVEGDRKVGELVALTGRAQNAVSYHLRELRTAGLVSSRRSSADGRDSYYRVHIDRYGELMGAAAAALDPTLTIEVAQPSLEALRRRDLRVLFLCTGNSARSQMAAALLEHRSDGAVRTASAGSHPKALHPDAVRAMAERGIDISGNAVTLLDDVVGDAFDCVVTLCDKVKEVCPDVPGHPRLAHWSMPDPSTSDAGYEAFTDTADEIDSRVALLLAQLAHEPQEARRADR